MAYTVHRAKITTGLFLLKVNAKSILSARDRIAARVRRTPLEESLHLSKRFDTGIFLKLENWQKTGSFKIRGALNKMLTLTRKERQKGVVTASAGNHALGVAQAAAWLGIRTTIFVPEGASQAKVKVLQAYDLDLIQQGVDYDESEELAWQFQERAGAVFIHAFSDPEIIAGQGTIGLEIVDDLPGVETVIVPIGGGGLISGVALAAKSQNGGVKVQGVQSEASPAMYDALQAGKVVESPVHETIADGLAGRFVTDLTLGLVQEYVDDVVLVPEQAIADAVRLLFEWEHFIVEGSAAVCVAALLAERVRPQGKTAVVITGRNIAPETVRQIL